MNRYTLELPMRGGWIRIWVIALVALGLSAPVLSAANLNSRMIPHEEAQQLGLTRAWFGHIDLDPARNHVERAILTGNRLTVLTSAGVVQEFDAETGQSLWTAPIGNENYPSLGPTASDKYVALVNGSTLYVLDRADGRPIIIRRVGGAPGAAPALSQEFVFVPLVRGRIEAYPLSLDKKTAPWYYQSYGRMMVAPLATPETVVWTTDAGYLYVGNSTKAGMRYRMETGSDIVAPPAFLKPYVFVASTSGEVFAMQEDSGIRRWKYSTGFPIERTPAPVGDRVFVSTAEPSMHCINALTGDMLWEAPRVSQFAAASKTKVYGVDDLGALVVLDGASGRQLGRIAVDRPIHSLVNQDTDRLFLISREGVIECLREIDSKEPFVHPKPVATAPPVAGETAEPAAEAAAMDDPAEATTADEPATEEQPPKPAENFGVEDSDNPFGE